MMNKKKIVRIKGSDLNNILSNALKTTMNESASYKNNICDNNFVMNRIVKKAIRNAMMESENNNQNIDLGQISVIADKFRSYANEIDGFVEEYKTFYDDLMSITKRHGLVLNDVNQDGVEEFTDSGYQKQYEFSIAFVFGLPRDATEMDDDELDKWYSDCADVCNDIDTELNRNLNFMKYEIREDGFNIYVDVNFQLWW